MGAQLGHIAFVVVLLFTGCGSRIGTPDAGQPASPATVPPTAVTSIPERAPSAVPYADTDAEVRRVAETFVRGALEYDANSDAASEFLAQVAPVTTPRELDRLRKSSRANLDWRVLRDRGERVDVTVTGVSGSKAGGVVVRVERTTHTTFATVRDFVQLTLRLMADSGALRVADAEGGGL